VPPAKRGTKKRAAICPIDSPSFSRCRGIPGLGNLAGRDAQVLDGRAAFLPTKRPSCCPSLLSWLPLFFTCPLRLAAVRPWIWVQLQRKQILNLRLRLLFQRGLFLVSFTASSSSQSSSSCSLWSFSPGIATIGGAAEFGYHFIVRLRNDRLVFLLELFGLLLLCRFHWRFLGCHFFFPLRGCFEADAFHMQSARQTRARAAETVTYYKRVAYYLFVRTTILRVCPK